MELNALSLMSKSWMSLNYSNKQGLDIRTSSKVTAKQTEMLTLLHKLKQFSDNSHKVGLTCHIFKCMPYMCWTSNDIGLGWGRGKVWLCNLITIMRNNCIKMNIFPTHFIHVSFSILFLMYLSCSMGLWKEKSCWLVQA